MSIIYNVTIEPTKRQDLFQITWHNREKNSQNCFSREAGITQEETKRLWRMSKSQLRIGQKLFRFLDGENRCLRQALDRANRAGECLQLHLNTCEQTHDWPFELLADETFLLPTGLHLVRIVSTRGKGKKVTPRNRPLKLLFMASSALDVKPVLDFEQEEEAIFHITEKLPIHMEIEDSGTLEGLRSQLEQKYYDVVHLSGHTGISQNGRPYFIMENETGDKHLVLPYKLWNEALIENSPRLLFLSGFRTARALDRPEGTDAVSFARLLVKNYNVPAVLEWGRPLGDEQGAHAGKMILHELSRGKTISEAVQRARFELITDFPSVDKPAWPSLRLFGNGMELNAIVNKNQRWQPKPQRIKHVYLKNSQVKVLAEGFVGRRRQLQTGLRALKQDFDRVGVLLLGTGGLGKSCLAGKICERLIDHTLIIIHGKLNTITLESALTDAFIMTQDEKGQQILSQKEAMTKKLAKLCVTSFKEKNYLFLLDDFEQNLEGAEKGQPGLLVPEAVDLLSVLLSHLPFGDKSTQLLITSRYKFSLVRQGRDLVEERLQKVWLTGFRGAERRKKARALENIMNYPDQSLTPRLLAAGHGNPRLMEWLDLMVGRMETAEVKLLLGAVKDKQEDFIHQHVIRQLLRQGGKEFERFLRRFSIYRLPVHLEGVEIVALNTRIERWKSLLDTGMNLSMVEHDQGRNTYHVTPLIREELLTDLECIDTCHRAAFNYYGKYCGEIGNISRLSPHEYKKLEGLRETMDPVLSEEWIHHAFGCGEDTPACIQGFFLIFHLLHRTAYHEALRIGLLLQSEKKKKSSGLEEALILEGITCAYFALGENAKGSEYSQRAGTAFRSLGVNHEIFKALALTDSGSTNLSHADYREAEENFRQALPIMSKTYGGDHLVTAMTLNSLGLSLHNQGEFKKAIEHFEQALHMIRTGYGDVHDAVFSILKNLADSYKAIGDFKKAIRHYRQTLDIARKYYPEISPIHSAALNNLGSCYTVTGDYNQAIQYIQQALEIDRSLYDGDHVHIADKLSSLGAIYFARADYPKAVDLYNKALAIWERSYGKTHPQLALALNDLGEIWKARGDIAKSIQYHRQALTIEEVNGKDYIGNVSSLINLSGCYYRQDNYPDALSHLERALEICKKTYGDSHPQIAKILNNLGEIYRETGQTEKAIEYLHQSLEMSKTYFGDNHHEMAAGLTNLGSVYRDLGDHSRAVDYYKQALDLNRAAFGENHHEVADALFNLGMVRNMTGQHEMALECFREALTILKTIHGENHAHTAHVLNRVAFSYLALSDYQKVITHAKQALSITLPLYGEQNPEVVDNMTLLGLAHRCLGNHLEAIEYLGRVLTVSRKRYGEENREVSTIMAHLGMVYLEKGDPGKAEGYLEKAYEINNKLLGPENQNTKDIYAALKACQSIDPAD
jgi:tetratricopeptide (TPR) repeat protein